MSQQLVKFTSVSKSYGPRSILEGVSFSISKGDRLALIGRNGSGKSTLARMLVGIEESDSGTISRIDSSDIAYLPQEIEVTEGLTLSGYLKTALGELDQLLQQMEHLEQLMAAESHPDELSNLLHSYGELQELFSQRGGYDSEHRLDQVLCGLGLEAIDKTRSMSSLSGGEQRRVALAALLLRSPTLLILDEPTNHLDLAALEWLESYLATYSNTLLVISHDREFLDRVTNGILELSETSHIVTYFAGNYTAYVRESERREQEQLDAYDRYKQEAKGLHAFLKQQTFGLAGPSGPKDNNKMAYDKQGDSMAKLHARRTGQAKARLEELQRSPVERPSKPTWVSFHQETPELASEIALEATDISKRYNGGTLFTGLCLTIRRGERIALQGPNGCGKSTLARILAGVLTPDTGTARVAPQARLAYVEQGWESLCPHLSVLDEYRTVRGGLDEGELRSELYRYGLFTGCDVFRKVHTLSSGMKQKLKLAKAFACRPNVLILDEPTNHLDLKSIESLEKALRNFKGTLLLISHDRRLVESTRCRLFILGK